MHLSKTLILLAALAGLYGLLFGYNVGIIAGALPFIEQYFSVTPTSEDLMTAAVPLGAVAGVVFAALFSDRFGRRLILIACAVAFIIGSLLCGVSDGLALLTIARLTLGVAIGASSLAAPMLLAELAPASIRGAVVSAFQLMISVGILLSYAASLGLSPFDNWRLMLSLSAIPAIIALVGTVMSPESPRWLILKGQGEKARSVFATLHPENSASEVGGAVHSIETSLKNSQQAPPWSAFLKPSVRPVVTFAVILFLLQQLSGINAVIYYAPRILREAGLSGIPAQLLATVGLGALNLIMTIVAMVVVDRVGRRPLILTGFAGTTASLALITVSFATPGLDDAIVAVGGLFLFITFFAVSLGPLPWLYMSELFSMRLKTRGMALASCANWSMNFAVVFLFPVVLTVAGATMTFALFAGFCACGLAYSWLRAPETKGVPLEDLERQLIDESV